MVNPPVIIVQLIHLEGPFKGQIQEFSDNVISIGRHADCKLTFPSDLSIVSRKHAEIIREGNRFKLVDFSANGTEVNGMLVKESYLKGGDVLTIAPGGPKISFLTQISKEVPQPAVSPTPEPSSPKPITTPEPQRQEHHTPQTSQPAPPPPQPLPQPEQPQPQAQSPKTFPRSAEERVAAPLIIQFGATLRSYKELPVNIGKNPSCEFILDFPGILDRHAQLLFYQNQYWVKDLTGQQLVKVNQRPCEGEVPLQANDFVMLGPQGPSFQFLGGGRLAEMEQQAPKEPSPLPPPTVSQEQKKSMTDEVLNKAKSIFKKYIDS